MMMVSKVNDKYVCEQCLKRHIVELNGYMPHWEDGQCDICNNNLPYLLTVNIPQDKEIVNTQFLTKEYAFLCVRDYQKLDKALGITIRKDGKVIYNYSKGDVQCL